MMRLCSVPPDGIADAWPEVEEFLARSCAHGLGELTPEVLKSELEQGQAMLAVAVDENQTLWAAAVTQMVHQPDGKLVCHILACGGDQMRDWIGFLAELERGARGNGAAAMRFQGRLGWAWVLRDYDMCQIVYQKDLRH